MDVNFDPSFFYPLMLLGMALLLLPGAKPAGVLAWARLIVGCLCALWGVVLAFRMITVSG